MTNRKLFIAACITSLIAMPIKANEVEETITVVGTRTERSMDEVAATISVKTVEDIEREVARDIADLVRFEPGVSVSGTGDRFGLSGFNIRGIEGNRVLTLVDGIRVAEEFSFGPFLSSRRDYVDVDSLSRAEIARGPISSLWGSDALGGVVAFTTKSPS
ncbi:MAG: TonB-dependent receptor plug domain-containing protein, partial [Pseudomonadales bacterium]|nr:TonB-dependent receptor plug domain-containing protein [Pseudomonadales bacterium]